MGGFVSDPIIDRIRQAVDIVSLVRESVPLKKSGARFKALCPFHNEKTPSFIVSPDRQIFKCFGCGAGGDVFSFVMKTENVSFPEAMHILAERARIELPQYRTSGPTVGRDEKSRLLNINAWAAGIFHLRLLNDRAGMKALEYLTGRGVTRDTIEAFQLGYAADSWTALMDAGREKGFSPQHMAGAGLLLARQEGDGFYDRFRNRLMFPIRDARNRVIGFGARALDDSEPKYLNSPETPLFAKGRTLYGLDKARPTLTAKRTALIVEGYMDVITAHQHGIPWAVGVLGTALTRDHVRLLRRYVDEAIMLFDPDSAGQNSADRSIDAFATEELGVRVVVLPDSRDPDEFLREHGRDAFLRLVDQGVEGLTYKLERALHTVPDDRRSSATLVAKALDDVLATVALIPNTVTQSIEVRKITKRTGVPEPALLRRLSRLASARRYPVDEPDTPPLPADHRDPARELLEAMLSYPDTIPYVRAHLDLDTVHNKPVRELLARLLDLAGQVPRPAPEDLLAKTREEDQRTILEAMIGGVSKPNDSPQDWCRELLATLRERAHTQEADAISDELKRTADLDPEAKRRLFGAKLDAVRAAHEARGKLHIKQ